MSALPDAIGLCPNRTGDSSYVVAGVFLAADETRGAACDHCGTPLVVYRRELADSVGEPAQEVPQTR